MPMPAYMEVTGEKQGKIEGSVDQAGRENTILIDGMEHEIYIPRDRQSGTSTGVRVHNPLIITKVFDKSSPKLYQALCTGEHMTEVVIKWYRIAPTGQEEHYFTTTLEDAIVVSMKPNMPNCLDPTMESFSHMEDVAFTYRKVKWTWEADGIEAEDDWKAGLEK
jgi:type VI secretion system secreted protein Hcp